LKTCHARNGLKEFSNFREAHDRLRRAGLELQKHGIGIGNERRYLSSLFGWLLPEPRGCFAQQQWSTGLNQWSIMPHGHVHHPNTLRKSFSQEVGIVSSNDNLQF
jgi:hypothetical protein